MGTFGIVAISVCIGLLLSILFACIGTLIYFAYTIRINSRSLAEQSQKFYAENTEALSFQRGQLANILESSKQNLVSMRQEMRQALEAHGATVKEAVGKINGEALAAASRSTVQAVGRLERVAAAFQRLVADVESQPNDHGAIEQPWSEERAEEYGPETVGGPSIYEKRRPDDVLGEEQNQGDRIPIGL